MGRKGYRRSSSTRRRVCSARKTIGPSTRESKSGWHSTQRVAAPAGAPRRWVSAVCLSATLIYLPPRATTCLCNPYTREQERERERGKGKNRWLHAAGRAAARSRASTWYGFYKCEATDGWIFLQFRSSLLGNRSDWLRGYLHSLRGKFARASFIFLISGMPGCAYNCCSRFLRNYKLAWFI